MSDDALPTNTPISPAVRRQRIQPAFHERNLIELLAAAGWVDLGLNVSETFAGAVLPIGGSHPVQAAIIIVLPLVAYQCGHHLRWLIPRIRRRPESSIETATDRTGAPGDLDR